MRQLSVRDADGAQAFIGVSRNNGGLDVGPFLWRQLNNRAIKSHHLVAKSKHNLGSTLGVQAETLRGFDNGRHALAGRRERKLFLVLQDVGMLLPHLTIVAFHAVHPV